MLVGASSMRPFGPGPGSDDGCLERIGLFAPAGIAQPSVRYAQHYDRTEIATAQPVRWRSSNPYMCQYGVEFTGSTGVPEIGPEQAEAAERHASQALTPAGVKCWIACEWQGKPTLPPRSANAQHAPVVRQYGAGAVAIAGQASTPIQAGHNGHGAGAPAGKSRPAERVVGARVGYHQAVAKRHGNLA